MKALKHLIFLLALPLSLLAQSPQTLNWSGYPGATASKSLTLNAAWTGTVTVLAFTSPGGRTIAASLQPTFTQSGNTLTITLTAFQTTRMSGSTYLEVATGGNVRYKGYLILTYNYQPPSTTVVGGDVNPTILTLLDEKVSKVPGSRLISSDEISKLASLQAGGGGGSAISPFVPLFVFYGESNAAGATANSGLSASELLVRPAVQIINNTTLTVQSLQIGVNNYQDALGITSSNHGWEASLANAVEAGKFYNNPVYLVKAGQGGAPVALLAAGGSYWNKLTTRVDSMKANIRRLGKIPVTYLIYSQGINDQIAGTNITTWKTATQALFKALRGKLGYVPIIATQFSSTFSAYNAAYAEMQATDPFLFMVDVSGTTYQDAYHWDGLTTGMKLIGGRMWNIVTGTIGQNQEYQLSQAGALAGAAPTGTSTGGGGTPTTPPSITGIVGTATTYGTSSCGTSYTTATYGNLLNATAGTGSQTGSYWVNNTSNTSSGGIVANNTVNAGACFETVMQLDDQTTGNAVIMYLDSDAPDTYVGSSKNFTVGGVCAIGTGLYKFEGTGFTSIGSTSFPCQLRMMRSGSDIVYAKSENGGAWTTLSTSTGKLTGFSTLYVKLLQNQAASNKARLSVSK